MTESLSYLCFNRAFAHQQQCFQGIKIENSNERAKTCERVKSFAFFFFYALAHSVCWSLEKMGLCRRKVQNITNVQNGNPPNLPPIYVSPQIIAPSPVQIAPIVVQTIVEPQSQNENEIKMRRSETPPPVQIAPMPAQPNVEQQNPTESDSKTISAAPPASAAPSPAQIAPMPAPPTALQQSEKEKDSKVISSSAENSTPLPNIPFKKIEIALQSLPSVDSAKYDLQVITKYLESLKTDNPHPPAFLRPMNECSDACTRDTPYRSEIERLIFRNVLRNHPNKSDKIVYFGIGSRLFLQDWNIIATLCLLHGYKNFEIHLSDSDYEGNVRDVLPDWWVKPFKEWRKALDVFCSSLVAIGVQGNVTVHGKVSEGNKEEYPSNISICSAIAFEWDDMKNEFNFLIDRLGPNEYIYVVDVSARVRCSETATAYRVYALSKKENINYYIPPTDHRYLMRNIKIPRITPDERLYDLTVPTEPPEKNGEGFVIFYGDTRIPVHSFYGKRQRNY